MLDERRKYPRYTKTFPVIIHRPYNERRVETIDVSLGGIGTYNAQKYYELEQIVYMELILSPAESVYCNARVAWVYPHTMSADTYKVGLEFLDLSDGDREKFRTSIEST